MEKKNFSKKTRITCLKPCKPRPDLQILSRTCNVMYNQCNIQQYYIQQNTIHNFFALPFGIMSDAMIWVFVFICCTNLFAILSFDEPCSCHGNAGWDKKSCGTFFLIRQWFSLVDKRRDNIFVAWQDTALAIPKPPSQIRVYIEQSSMSMSAHRLNVKEDCFSQEMKRCS